VWECILWHSNRIPPDK